MRQTVTRPVGPKDKLSKDILAALLLAKRVNEPEVAERLLQALEVLAQGDLEDEDLSAAYLGLAVPARRRGLQ